MKKTLLLLAAALGAFVSFAETGRAGWMAGKRGMMVHWLFGEPGRIDYYVNAFDINRFMADFDATKSDYLIFTVGQNTGAYASPNSKITAYAGAGHCPTRDLVGEIAAAVHARGKKFIAYLPCELNANTTLHEGFGWPAAGSGKDMSVFQSRWLEVITEWATRWGSNLDGWWIDGYTDGGTHWPDAMSGENEALWAAAFRAGNANAVITFNNGLAKKTPRAGAVLSDYLAGEINSPSAIADWTLMEFAEGTTSCRTHFLMPIDGFWGGYWSWDQAGGANPYSGLGLPNQQTMNRLSYVGQFPDPVVSESDLSAMITRVFAVNGAVTINIGVNASGTLNPKSVALLAKMPGGSESTAAPAGTTVESLLGSWSSTPMANDGSTFSTDGDLVYAYSTASADKTVNGITFKSAADPTSASSDFEFSPAFNTTQNADSDGTSGDLATIARLAWKNSEKATKGYATMTFKGLTAGKRYLIQLYIHDTYCHNSAVFGPDAKSTVFYRSEESDPRSGKDWTCGGVFTGIITAKGTTHEITLNYPTTDRIELNALQVRCLGDAGEDPDPAADDPDTSWMKGSFGVSFHWTAKIVDNYGSKNWEQAVNDFDVGKFADSVESFGAKHVIFTTAHAWQKLPCPCTALDSLISGRTTTRDLLKDIIDELTNRNIRVVFYYNHSCNHNEDQPWDEASGYDAITDAQSMTNFANKICSIVRELSLRYGDGVSAWWFDSASSVDDSLPWTGNKTANNVAGLSFPWDDLFAAARAGNPHAAVAVNWDVHQVDQHGLATDYLSGETEKIDAYGNFFPFAPDELQDHIWTRMDSNDWFWQGGEVSGYGSRFTEEQLAWWKVSHRDAGRMATLNLVIDEAGNINPVVAQRLVNTKTIGKVWVQGRYDPTKWQAAPAASNLALTATSEFTGNRSGTSGSYHDTPMSVLTDGSVPTTEIVAGANLNAIATQIFGSKDEGDVFSWAFNVPSDIYGLNIYSRSGRSQYNGATDGGNDAIVVTKVEVQSAGSSEWTDIGAPAISFGKQDGISGGALAAKLVDGTGAPLATGVKAIRFTQGAPENNTSLLVECEVIGCKASGENPPPDDPPAEEPPVYTLTIPTETGLELVSVSTNGTAVAASGNAYAIVSNTVVTITFTAASGYELDGNDGVVTKTVVSDCSFASSDYPAVKKQSGGEDPVDPPPGPGPGELVNGRANMKGWAMKRISTTAKVASEVGFGWSAGDNPSSKSYSSVTESVMTFTDAQVVNTIQLFAPKSENNTIPQVVNQMPSAFKVYGSNDGSAWTELLSVSGEADWLSMECRYYTFSNTTAYVQYKLEVVSTVGGGSAKLGVYNYFQTIESSPTTPWVYANNKLTRGDQEINVWKDGQTLKVSGSIAEGAIYDLDFTAGIVDGDGNALAYTFNLEQKLQGNKELTRLIGGKVVSRINGWGCQNCWYLNELSLGEAFAGFADRQAFENDYSLEWLDMESTPVETLPSNTFTCNYNLKGDLVLHVKTFSSKFNGSRITSIRLDEVVTYGDNNYFGPFEGCVFLTNITLGANLMTINCKQAFGKISVPVSIRWNSAPPEFTQGTPDVFNDKNFVYHKVTSYLPLAKRAEWETFAGSVTKFKLDLPATDDGEGTWYTGNTSFEQVVRWWNDAEEPVIVIEAPEIGGPNGGVWTGLADFGSGDAAAFSIAITNPQEGVTYEVWSSPTLDGEFAPDASALIGEVVDGVKIFTIKADGPSKFVKIVATPL